MALLWPLLVSGAAFADEPLTVRPLRDGTDAVTGIFTSARNRITIQVVDLIV